MRPHFPRPLTARERPAAAERDGSERLVAEALLGRRPSRLYGCWAGPRPLSEQLVWVTAVQAAGVVFLAGGMAFGLSLVVAAAVVQVGLACRVAVLRALPGARLCLELIVAGHATLPLPCIERSRRRLLDGRTAELLATSIDDMVATAARPAEATRALPAGGPARDPRGRPGASPGGRRFCAPDPAVRGVALVEWLLTSAATPLYGSEVEPLRQELRRALYLLAQNDESRGA